MPTAAPPVSASFTCLVDDSAHQTLDELHKHLRKLKVKQEDYYTQYAPQRDRATGEIIPFKAPAAEYLKREFLSKETLQLWFEQEPVAAREWAVQWLVNRRAEKRLVYAPCQVELRTLLCPSRHYYDKVIPVGYNDLCANLGYTPRFSKTLNGVRPPRLPCPIVIDTREQRPLTLKHPTVRGTLRSADYGLPAEHDQSIYIERKSLSDFIGTLSSRETRPGDSNLERFGRELERVTEIGGHVVMVVEASLEDAMTFNSAPHLKREFERVRVHPDHLFHNLRDLLQHFPLSFQALFVANRDEAAAAVVEILSHGPLVRDVDLQREYELSNLVR